MSRNDGYELFVDRLPLVASNGRDPLFRNRWATWLPVLATNIDEPPSSSMAGQPKPMPWLFDSGHNGAASSWANHLQSGCQISAFDLGQILPNWGYFSSAASQRYRVLIRKASLWLFSNIERFRDNPMRLALNPGIFLMDSVEAISRKEMLAEKEIPETLAPKFKLHPPPSLIGIEAIRNARLRIQICFRDHTVSVWRPSEQERKSLWKRCFEPWNLPKSGKTIIVHWSTVR